MRKVGFIGLGTMGLPMAVNMARSGLELMVFNRTGGKAGPALDAGAMEADSPLAVFKCQPDNGRHEPRIGRRRRLCHHQNLCDVVDRS